MCDLIVLFNASWILLNTYDHVFYSFIIPFLYYVVQPIDPGGSREGVKHKIYYGDRPQWHKTNVKLINI